MDRSARPPASPALPRAALTLGALLLTVCLAARSAAAAAPAPPVMGPPPEPPPRVAEQPNGPSGVAAAASEAAATAPAAATPAPASPRPSDAEGLSLRRADGAARSGRGADGRGSPPSASASALRIGLSLAAVVGLILLARWAGRRFFGLPGGPGTATAALRIVGRAPLAPRQHLLLLHVGNRLVVLANNGSSVNSLCEITDPDEVALVLGQAQRKGDVPRGLFTSLVGSAGQRLAQGRDGADDAEDSVAEGLAEDVETPDDPAERDGLLQGDEAQAAAASDDVPAPDPADPAVRQGIQELHSTRRELGGLLEKVKLLSEQFRRP